MKHSRTLVSRPWLTLHEQCIELPGGGQIDEFHLVEGPDWVGVLAVTAEAQVVLVEQYRHGVGAISRELPAGVIEPAEAPLAAAQRELLEETGYAADDWSELLSVATEPTRHTSRARFFLARGARRTAAPALDPTERIRVVLSEPAALVAAAEAGEIVHGLHVGAIYAARARGLL